MELRQLVDNTDLNLMVYYCFPKIFIQFQLVIIIDQGTFLECWVTLEKSPTTIKYTQNTIFLI